MMKKIFLFSLIFLNLFSEKLIIRKAKKSEIKEIAQLYHDSWHATFKDISPLSSQRTPELCLKKWQEYYQKKDKFFMLVALEDKKIVGISFAGPIELPVPDKCEKYDCEVDKLYILNELKNKGIGTKLLNENFKRLKSLNFKKAIIKTHPQNNATNAFYEKRNGRLITYQDGFNIYGFTL